MIIQQSGIFARRTKKLDKRAKAELDKAVKAIVQDTNVGELKIGDLMGVRVYKYKHLRQLYLLAYEYDMINDVLFLLSHGTHENFYSGITAVP